MACISMFRLTSITLFNAKIFLEVFEEEREEKYGFYFDYNSAI